MNVIKHKIFAADESRIRSDLKPVSCSWWLRSTYSYTGYSVGYVYNLGYVYSDYAYNNYGVLPACTI